MKTIGFLPRNIGKIKMSEDNRTRYYLKSPATSVTVTVKDIGYGRRIITGVGVAGTVDEFIGQDLNRLLAHMEEQGQVEMMEI